MDLNHLEYFIAIAEEKNISRAAQKLFVSQPTLSRYLIMLEENLGVCLFNRIKNSLILTYAGEVFLKSAREILNIKKQIYNDIEDITDFKKGNLKIGIPPDRGSMILPNVFPEFHKKYPGIKVDIVEGVTKTIEKLTLQGHIDYSLIVHYEHEIKLDYDFICNEEIILVVPKSHRLAYLAENIPSGKRPVIDLSLFKDDPFILIKNGTKTRDVINNMFRDAGFEPNIILEVGSVITIQNAVAKGSALSILPEKSINYSAVGNDVVCFSINPEKYYWPIIIAYRRGSYPTRVCKDFISMLSEHLNSNTIDIEL